MRVLVTWGSKRGGTEGIARIIGEVLEQRGHQVTLLPGSKAAGVMGFEAAVVGGALYATRWHRDARRFVARRVKDLRTVPVWFFSSGPLDDSAEHGEIPHQTSEDPDGARGRSGTRHLRRSVDE
jgi:menaquinone-dependent protoporphyrinogen oxidase